MRVRLARLPAGYREVEYLESTNLEYINTTKTVDSTCVISFEFQYVSLVGGYNRIFGARNGNGKGLLNMRTASENSGNFYLEFSGGIWNTKAFDLQKHKVILDAVNHKLYVDGSVVTSSFYIADNTEGAMWLFGTNQGGSTSNVRFFNYKLVKNSSLEQNLVPCIKVDTMTPGMFDTVNSVFYTNQGTGEFLYGKFTDTGKIKIPSKLPIEYQEVTYLQTRLDQKYGIDLGLKLTSTMTFELEDTPIRNGTSISYGTTYGIYLLGCARSLDSNGVEIYTWGDYMQLHANSEVQFPFVPYKKYKYTYKSTNMKVHDEAGNLVYNWDMVTNLPSYSNIHLFCTYRETFTDYSLSGVHRFHYFKLYDNGSLIKHLIPCYRKTDQVAGLYDLVNDVFYTNDTSGIFDVGKDVDYIIKCRPVICIPEATSNLITRVTSSNAKCPLAGNGVDVQTVSGDAYCGLTLAQSTVQGETYTLSFEVSGMGENDVCSFGLYKSGMHYTTRIYNGRNVIRMANFPFAASSLTFDDSGRSNTNIIHIRNFQFEKKDHATPYTKDARAANTII